MNTSDTTFADLWKQHDYSTVSHRIESATQSNVRRALAKEGRKLEMCDLEALLSPSAEPFLEDIAQQSHRLTVARFGHTMQMFAPLYLSNICMNTCTYCGFSGQNQVPRKVLTEAEILTEAKELKNMGIDHILLVAGEARKVGYTYYLDVVKLLRPMFSSISLEVQPLSTSEYTSLANNGVSAVILYQETYDPVCYAKHHIKGPKANITNRLETPDRLGQAHVKKIGLGALHGLGNWRTETVFLGLHLRYLERRYWQTRYSVSFPRLRPHEGQKFSVCEVSERNLAQMICALRLWSNETELVLSTRERPAFRDNSPRLGITTMSAGARTNPGGYAQQSNDSLEQFVVNDNRSAGEIGSKLKSVGYEVVWKDWDATYDAQA